MNRASIALVSLLLLCSGCAVNHAANKDDPRWLLMASPSTEEYPWGSTNVPLALWQPIMTYPSKNTCDQSLREAQNVVQSPVACVAANDTQLVPSVLAVAVTSHD